jgi:predicted ArsR family transcriptional regulator
MILMLESLFGNETAERVLLYLTNYGEAYANGVGKTFGISASQALNQLLRLEAGGILVSRMVGRTKVFTFNPRWAFKEDLTNLLEKALARLPESETKKYYRERTRPRRSGKIL